MNIFEDMKVFIKSLAVVSPVSEINVNSDTVYTPYGAFNTKDLFLIFKTPFKDKNDKEIYVGDIITDRKNKYEVYFNLNKGYSFVNECQTGFTPYFLTEETDSHFEISDCEIISNKYVEMQERAMQKRNYEKWKFYKINQDEFLIDPNKTYTGNLTKKSISIKDLKREDKE